MTMPQNEQTAASQFTQVKYEFAASTFLHVLDPQTNNFTYQTFDDNIDRKDENLARIFQGTFNEHRATLENYSRAGAGIYVTINETDLRGRKAANIVRVRAYSADLDGTPLANLKRFKLIPRMLVATSPNKWHAHYLVHDAPLEQFKQTQKRLAELVDGDVKACGLERVWRLPGFPHRKQPNQPFPIELLIRKA